MVSQSFNDAYKNDNQPFVIMIDSKEYEGFITYVRVNKDILPDGWYAYDLREEDGEICELKDGYIWVAHLVLNAGKLIINTIYTTTIHLG